jgi:hypothetical protein
MQYRFINAGKATDDLLVDLLIGEIGDTIRHPLIGPYIISSIL